jgi:hypothetical protein
MKLTKYIKNSLRYYFIGFLLILIGVILVYTNYNQVYYAIIGIGLLFIVFGINESMKSI